MPLTFINAANKEIIAGVLTSEAPPACGEIVEINQKVWKVIHRDYAVQSGHLHCYLYMSDI